MPPASSRLSVKERGDFTRTMRDVEPGSRVYVDGPHGVFSCDRYEGPGFVFIGGGVGVTPLLCMLRTLADRDDRRPCHLFLANHDPGAITFGEEIEELEHRLDLTVVHVLRNPPSTWTGESGYVTAETLRRHLPDRHSRFQYFVCGPTGDDGCDGGRTRRARRAVRPRPHRTVRDGMSEVACATS